MEWGESIVGGVGEGGEGMMSVWLLVLLEGGSVGERWGVVGTGAVTPGRGWSSGRLLP